MREEGELLEQMVYVLVAAGPFAYGREEGINSTAQEWLDLGFGPEEAYDWLLLARCFDAKVAVKLKEAGIDPDEAAAKDGKFPIGFHVANGTMTVEKALELTAPIREARSF